MPLVKPSALYADQIDAYVALCRGCQDANKNCPHRWSGWYEEQCVDTTGPKPLCIHRRKTRRRERKDA